MQHTFHLTIKMQLHIQYIHKHTTVTDAYELLN